MQIFHSGFLVTRIEDSHPQSMQVLPIPRLPVKRQFVLLNGVLPFIPYVVDETQQIVVTMALLASNPDEQETELKAQKLQLGILQRGVSA